MLETDLVPDGQVGLIPRQLTEEQVASILGVSVAWCQRMRWAGGGPPYRKIARDTALARPVSPTESSLLERVTRAVRMPPNARLLAGTDEEGRRGDFAWFQAYPHRSHRVRSVTRGEREAFRVVSLRDAAFTHAIVRQVEPGSRLKCPIDFTHCPGFADSLSDSPETDFFLSELFDAAFSGEKPFSIRSVMEAAMAKYAARGRA